jgi:predicted transcriptional regulator
MTSQAIEDFITTFNRVEKSIREQLSLRGHTDLGDAIREYEQRNRSWRRGRELRVLANLRNVLVHDHVVPKKYLAHPSDASMVTLRAILEELERPERVIPKFQRPVACVSADDTLAEVMTRIHKDDFSQFPVYDGETFRGLLTENGIVKYLAHHRVAADSIIDFSDVYVRSLLRQDENRANYAFADRNERLDTMLDRFVNQPVLEAVLITANAKKDEKLLGIVTQWDALEARKGIR